MDKPYANQKRFIRAAVQDGARASRLSAPEAGCPMQPSAPPAGGPDRGMPEAILAPDRGERARQDALAEWEGEGGRICWS